MKEIKSIHPETREEWRAWLQKNHKKETRVWLLKHKRHTGKPQVNNNVAMDEAICFGWIDTIIKKVDENTYKQQFARRTDKSKWSSNTIARAERMIKEKLMSPEGMKRYKEGKKKPLLDADIPKNPDMPKELREALQKNQKAKKYFAEFPPSYKRMIFRWLIRAKRPETKEKRIKTIVEKAEKNEKLFG